MICVVSSHMDLWRAVWPFQGPSFPSWEMASWKGISHFQTSLNIRLELGSSCGSKHNKEKRFAREQTTDGCSLFVALRRLPWSFGIEKALFRQVFGHSWLFWVFSWGRGVSLGLRELSPKAKAQDGRELPKHCIKKGIFASRWQRFSLSLSNYSVKQRELLDALPFFKNPKTFLAISGTNFCFCQFLVGLIWTVIQGESDYNGRAARNSQLWPKIIKNLQIPNLLSPMGV